jgi:hypothetical protein
MGQWLRNQSGSRRGGLLPKIRVLSDRLFPNLRDSRFSEIVPKEFLHLLYNYLAK